MTTTNTTNTNHTNKDNNIMETTTTINDELDAMFQTRDSQRAAADRKNKEDIAKRRAVLATLGGALSEENDIVFRGTQLVIPERMSLKEAGKQIAQKIEDEEQEYSITRVFDFLPWDGALATAETLKEVFGMTFGRATYSMFGKNPPELRDIKIGPGANDTVQVPWGSLSVPAWGDDAAIFLHSTRDTFGTLVFALQVSCKRKARHEVEGLFKLIQDRLEEKSIYRGRAITASMEPEFIDLSTFDPSQVVYSQDTMRQLELHLWGPIRYRKAFEGRDQRSKRVTMLHGTFGTGKTLAALKTAVECEQVGLNGGQPPTFIMCRPGLDNWRYALSLARLYGDSVIFIEDADLLIEDNDPSKMSALLEEFDGALKKGLDVKLVLTTNYIEKIPKGMLRPGRMDAVIEIGTMDEAGVQRLLTRLVGDKLADDIDFAAIYQSVEGLTPAFVREVLDRAVAANIVNSGGEVTGVFSTQDFVDAANSLRPQLELMNDAPEAQRRPTLDTAFEQAITSAVTLVKGTNSSIGVIHNEVPDNSRSADANVER